MVQPWSVSQFGQTATPGNAHSRGEWVGMVATQDAKHGVGTRDTRRRFEQWARNPECEANATSAILGVSMVEVAKREGLQPTMGQSPFALQRGQRFERQLFRDDAQLMRAELEKVGVLPAAPLGFLDLRMRHLGGTCRDLDDARARTLDLLGSLAKNGLAPRARVWWPAPPSASPAVRCFPKPFWSSMHW
jgi:hypothetical protein